MAKHLTKRHACDHRQMLRRSKQSSSVASSGPRTLSTEDLKQLLAGDCKNAEQILRTKVGLKVHDLLCR